MFSTPLQIPEDGRLTDGQDERLILQLIMTLISARVC